MESLYSQSESFLWAHDPSTANRVVSNLKQHILNLFDLCVNRGHVVWSSVNTKLTKAEQRVCLQCCTPLDSSRGPATEPALGTTTRPNRGLCLGRGPEGRGGYGVEHSYASEISTSRCSSILAANERTATTKNEENKAKNNANKHLPNMSTAQIITPK